MEALSLQFREQEFDVQKLNVGSAFKAVFRVFYEAMKTDSFLKDRGVDLEVLNEKAMKLDGSDEIEVFINAQLLEVLSGISSEIDWKSLENSEGESMDRLVFLLLNVHKHVKEHQISEFLRNSRKNLYLNRTAEEETDDEDDIKEESPKVVPKN